jgi:hypothetical protein
MEFKLRQHCCACATFYAIVNDETLIVQIKLIVARRPDVNTDSDCNNFTSPEYCTFEPKYFSSHLTKLSMIDDHCKCDTYSSVGVDYIVTEDALQLSATVCN